MLVNKHIPKCTRTPSSVELAARQAEVSDCLLSWKRNGSFRLRQKVEMSMAPACSLLGFFLNNAHGNSLLVVSVLLLGSGLEGSSLTLLLEFLLSHLLLLHLVDGLDQNGLVLELVTLGGNVEVMVDILGDLLSFSVLFEKSSKDSLSSHPEHLGGHTGVSGSLSLSHTLVSALPLGCVHSLASRSGVHVHRSLHDKTIVVKFSDVFP